MPATVNHVLTMTTPDNPAYENRPSHWNSSHALTINATGSEISGAFSNANGVSFGLSAGAVTASHNALTSQSNQALSAANGSFTFQTAQYHNSNGVSWSTTTGSGIIASVAAQTNQTVGGYFVGNTTGQSSSSTVDARSISVDGAGIVSAGWSNGSIRISATQSNQAMSAAGGSSAFQTLGFSDNAYASFTNSNGSVAVTELRGSFYAASNTTQSTSGTQNLDAVSFAGAGGVSVGVTNGSIVISGGGGTTNQTGPNIAAGTQTATSGTVVFSNSNNMTFGMSDSSVVTASFNAINIGVSTGGNTAGSTGTIEGAGGQYILVGSNGITLSQSTNGGNLGTVTINGWTVTNYYISPPNMLSSGGAITAASGFVRELWVPTLVSGSRIDVPLSINVATAANNSTARLNLSHTVVLYTKNAETLSSVSSTTWTQSATWTSNATGSVTGAFFLSAAMNATMTPGVYFAALQVSNSTGGATGANTTNLTHTVSYMQGGNYQAFTMRELGAGTTDTTGWNFFGRITHTTNFSTIAVSNISKQGVNLQNGDWGFRLQG